MARKRPSEFDDLLGADIATADAILIEDVSEPVATDKLKHSNFGEFMAGLVAQGLIKQDGSGDAAVTRHLTLGGNLSFSSNDHAGLRANSLTTTQKNALGIADNGSFIYDETLNRLQGREGGAWHSYARLGGDTFTGAVGVPDGTLIAPSFRIGSTYPVVGFYNTGVVDYGGGVLAGVLGTADAENEKRLSTLQYRLSNFGDNVWAQWGTGSTYPNQVSDVYAMTLSAATAYMANGASSGGYVAMDLGSSVLRFTGSGAYLGEFVEHEMDKLDLYADGGAVTVALAGTTRFTAAVPHAGVTILRNFSIRVGGNSGIGEGTTEEYYGILFTGHAWLTGDKNYGLFFDEEAPDGDIATADGVPFKIISSVSAAGIAAGQIDLIARNSGGTINITAADTGNGLIDMTAGGATGTIRGTTNTRDNMVLTKDIVTFDTDASGQINLNIGGVKGFQVRGGTGFLRQANTALIAFAANESSAAELVLSTYGTASGYLRTNNTNATALRWLDVASAVNHLVISPAVSGGNANLNVSAENLLFGSGAAIATTATAGYIMVPAMAGTPTGVPVGNGAGAIALVYDTSANKIWFYNGGWRGVLVA